MAALKNLSGSTVQSIWYDPSPLGRKQTFHGHTVKYEHFNLLLYKNVLKVVHR